MMINFKLLILILFLLVLLYPASLSQTSVMATASCGSSGTALATGLVTSPTIGEFVTGSGACVEDPKAAFLKIPTFDDLKSIYYTQSKANKSLINSLPDTIVDNYVYLVNGDLTVKSTPSGGTAVVFVENDLNFNVNYCYETNCSSSPAATVGTVFVVRGNVNIGPTVTRIDAVIIASGTIYTAGGGCVSSSVNISPLTINGSLISLTDTSPPRFCRKLTNNNQPAEKINHQVKYLVLLRNLMSDTLQRWSEIQ